MRSCLVCSSSSAVGFSPSFKRTTTATKFSYGWNRWSRWAQSKRGVPIIPACPLHVALYLLELTEDALQKNVGCSVIDSALYGIRWAHKVAGLESPAQHPTVVAAAEGAKRKLSRPVQPKQPLALEAVVRIAHFYNTASASLAVIRFLFVLLIGYAGLFRISELLNLKVKDISISCAGMTIFVSQRKNDQFREGHTSVIARSSKVSCPVAVTEKVLALLKDSKESCFPVIRRIVRNRYGSYFHKSLGVSCSTVRDEFKKYLSPFVENVDDFCLHSLKSGGASNEGYKLSDPELKDRHAGWKNP